MSVSIQNLRTGRRLRVMSLFLPFAALPLLAMGVTVPVARMAAVDAAELARARVEADEADEARERLATFGSLDQLDEIERTSRLLRGLLPPERTDVELFNQLRFAADGVGIQLKTLSINRPEDTGYVVGDTTAFERHVEVSGQASLDQVWALVEQLRTQGIPTVAHQLRVSRGRPSDRLFQFSARLGVFHGGPSTGASESMASAPVGE